MADMLQLPVVRLTLFILMLWALAIPPLLLGAVIRRRHHLVPLTGPLFATYACLILLLVCLATGFHVQVIAITIAAPPLCGIADLATIKKRTNKRGQPGLRKTVAQLSSDVPWICSDHTANCPHPACRDEAKDGELAATERDFPAPIRLVRMEQKIRRR